MSLNITLTQTIESVQVRDGGNIIKDATGITWYGRVRLFNILGNQVECRYLLEAIAENKFISIASLNTQAQPTYSKDYDACTIVEAKAVRHAVLGGMWKTAMKALDDESPNAKVITMSDADIDSLVENILSLCHC